MADSGGGGGEPGEPHPAIYYSLPLLPLRDILAVESTCRSLRAAVAGDALLWRHINIEPPLSSRLTDSALLRLVARAQGELKLLRLDGHRSTSCGSSRVVVSDCHASIGGEIVKVVGLLCEQNKNLQHMELYGINNTSREHFGELKSLWQKHVKGINRDCKHGQNLASDDNALSPFDMHFCVQCWGTDLVFDCNEITWKYNCCWECRGYLCAPCWVGVDSCSFCSIQLCRRCCYPGEEGLLCPECAFLIDRCICSSSPCICRSVS